MTIRTLEEFENLRSTGEDGTLRHSHYLPIALAFVLPDLLDAAGFDFASLKSLEDAIKVINPYLKDNPTLACRGFVREKIFNDGTGFKTDMHQCEICFAENIRTHGEANEFKSGMDSVGIHFLDPDDDYNDWIWVSVDVIIKAWTGPDKAPMPDYSDFLLYVNTCKDIKKEIRSGGIPPMPVEFPIIDRCVPCESDKIANVPTPSKKADDPSYCCCKSEP